ncbi:hypothetical protein CRE_24286 [Caenorhabditis remanei]|uniref:ascorbate ferrireductase (transmembrane) n=1 Tax=Caenorhabditis remanei TaxID=31234 RepID=E3NKY0_CAERE|nr:hypothetical protein CRE_24286 [Caenorhabditis remanei]
MYKFLVFLLAASLVSAATKCPSNAFCFSAKDDTNITVSCNKDSVLSLKWKTSELRSTVVINNGLNLLQFTCGFPVGDSNLDVKLYKFENVRAENLTSCQIDFHLNHMFKKVSFSTKHRKSCFQNAPSLLQWNEEKSEVFKFEEICSPIIEAGLSKEFKRFLVKAHAIFMLLGWLFFVPTGFLFARFGKQLFQNQKLVGMPVWFQIHRSFTFLGVWCICTSIVCIFVSTNFTWKGTGSGAWYWTQWHADLGTISTVLAVSQPLNSLLR